MKLMTAYRLHFEPANLEVIKLIEQGRIGEPRFFSSTFAYQVQAGKHPHLRRARRRRHLGHGRVLRQRRALPLPRRPEEVFAHAHGPSRRRRASRTSTKA